jgi:hypothetical protein
MKTLSDDDQFQATAVFLHSQSTSNTASSLSPPDLQELKATRRASKGKGRGYVGQAIEQAMMNVLAWILVDEEGCKIAGIDGSYGRSVGY